MRAGSAEKKTHHLSLLLSPEENQQVFSLLDKKCLSLSTCVVQLFCTKGPDHSSWLKQCTGALSLVKDANKRSYYCRIYCLMRNELVWEHELYSTIEFKKPRPYLINFEGESGHCAFNFAAEEEADHFFRFASKMMESLQRRRQRSAPQRPTSNPPLAPGEQDPMQSKYPSRDMAPAFNMPLGVGKKPGMGSGGHSAGGGASSGKRAFRKIDKKDISAPTDFKHVMHIGWNEQKGFDLTGDEVKTLRPFLEKAGVSEAQLHNRKTRDFIYEFVKTNNVLEKVAPEPESSEPESLTSQTSITATTKSRPPPPVPSRNNHRTNGSRVAPPPPPPTSSRLLQQQSTTTTTQSAPKVRGPPPGRPSPPNPQNNNNVSQPNAAPPAPPPPPPPPPPPAAPPMPGGGDMSRVVPEIRTPAVAAPDGRSALLDDIRKGANLKKVNSSGDAVAGAAANTSTDSRSDLMQEIRQRKELRPVSEREVNQVNRSSSGEGTDALADALRRALQERGRVIRSSDEDSCTSSDNDGEWDD